MLIIDLASCKVAICVADDQPSSGSRIRYGTEQQPCLWQQTRVLSILSLLQALRQVQQARKGLAGAGVAGFLALVAFLGKGSLLVSAGPIASLALAALSAVAYVQMQRLEDQFIFTDWVNHEK